MFFVCLKEEEKPNTARFTANTLQPDLHSYNTYILSLVY